MKDKNNNAFANEIIAAFVLILLVGALLNPFNWFMSGPVVMMLILSLVVVFILFTAFIWKERARDERELWHRTIAGRVAFLSGTAVLILGIIIQGLNHNVDVWLVLTLTVMIFAKIITSIYNNLNN